MTKPLLPLGIWFNLPFADYLADPGLGSSDQKAIAIDPVDWQHARLSGEDDVDTPSLLWGRGLHARVLEGRKAFNDQFAVAPSKADYPGLLDTMDDLRAHAKGMGWGPLGRTKAEAIEALRKYGYEGPIWDEIVARFETANKGKSILTAKQATEIETAAEWMQRDALLSAVMEDGTFVAGYGEVSIIYETDATLPNGEVVKVRCKARLDRLLTHAIVDLKHFRPWGRDKSVRQAAIEAVAGYRYDLQAHSYLRAWRAGRALFKAGQVFLRKSTIEQLKESVDGKIMEFLSEVYRGEADPSWVWVAVKATGAPQPLVIEWRQGGFAWGAAANEIQRAINVYAEKVAEFGVDKPWPPRHPAQIIDSDDDWPSWLGR